MRQLPQQAVDLRHLLVALWIFVNVVLRHRGYPFSADDRRQHCDRLPYPRDACWGVIEPRSNQPSGAVMAVTRLPRPERLGRNYTMARPGLVRDGILKLQAAVAHCASQPGGPHQ